MAGASPLTSESPAFTWADVGENIDFYQVKILNYTDDTELVTWTALESGGKITGLSLNESTLYYAEIRSVDSSGRVSESVNTEPWIPSSDNCYGSSITNSPFANSNNGGDGLSALTAFKICTQQQLNQISDNPLYMDKYFSLAAHIDLSSFSNNEFNMIGSLANPFRGEFEGNSRKIKNLVINLPAINNVGLFSYVQETTIKNLDISNFNLTANNESGGLIGVDNGALILDNITATSVMVSGNTRLAGLIGFNKYNGSVDFSEISNIYLEYQINATSNAAGFFAFSSRTNYSNVDGTATVNCDNDVGECGGMIGMHDRGSFLNMTGTFNVSCMNTTGGCGGVFYWGDDGVDNFTATVTVTSDSTNMGGFSSGFNCYRRMSSNIHITGVVSGSTNVGGLFGSDSCDRLVLEDSSFTGTVTGTNVVGGIVGEANAPNMDRVFMSGTVIGNDNVGGLWGDISNYSAASGNNINDVYVVADITGNNRVGGLGGSTVHSQLSLNHSFFLGTITGNTNVGGLIGHVQNDPNAIYVFQSNYWALTGGAIAPSNSVGSSGAGAVVSIAGKIEPKVSANYLLQGTFLGFDFATIWQLPGIATHPSFQ